MIATVKRIETATDKTFAVVRRNYHEESVWGMRGLDRTPVVGDRIKVVRKTNNPNLIFVDYAT